KTPEKHNALEQTEAPAAAILPSTDPLIKKAKPNQKHDGKDKGVPKAEPCHNAKLDLPIKGKLEQKEAAALETPQLRGAEREPKPTPLTQKNNSQTTDVVLEKPTTPQNKSEPSKHVEAVSLSPQSEDHSKSTSLELQFPIIDDCPPRPAPFDHRIVSAKQVLIGSYYSVEPNSLLGG
ncbi:myosin light chain kinase 3, partial [Tachysurus ichikawai]